MITNVGKCVSSCMRFLAPKKSSAKFVRFGSMPAPIAESLVQEPRRNGSERDSAKILRIDRRSDAHFAGGVHGPYRTVSRGKVVRFYLIDGHISKLRIRLFGRLNGNLIFEVLPIGD